MSDTRGGDTLFPSQFTDVVGGRLAFHGGIGRQDDFLEFAAGKPLTEPVESELFASLHFIEDGIAGFLEFVGFGMAEIDEVAVVGECAFGTEAVVGAVLFEGFDALLRQRFGDPLPLVLGEERKRVGVDGRSVQGCVFHSAAGADMGSHSFH